MRSKILKIIGIIVVSLIVIYIIFIAEEVIRFNKVLGSKPLLLLDQDKIDLTSETGIVNKQYLGLGYVIEYEYNVTREENSDVIEVAILGGEFKLFGKIMLSAWIQCVATPNETPEESSRIPENVIIEVLEETITRESAEILITDNNKESYGWGVAFKMEKKTNGNWQELKTSSGDLSFIEIAYEIDENNQLKQKVNYGRYYGLLENGTYRIVKPVYDNGYINLYSNEFEIK